VGGGLSMKLWHDLWVPDYETMLGNSFPYQRDKFLAATGLRWTTDNRRGLALDVGAHVGLWTLQLLECFDRVLAFEPDPAKHQCFDLNVKSDRVTLLRIALGNGYGQVGLNQKPGTSLKTHVDLRANGIVMQRLDDLGIVGVDFLKIDVEGYDYFVVVGAEHTIKRDRPVIIVEQKPGVASKRYKIGDIDAVKLLMSWGYVVEAEMHGDYIMLPGGQNERDPLSQA
jgi:FkbM family methyltransferase